MSILLTAGNFTQFISVLIIFVVVLGITAWATKWVANYQKQQGSNSNIEVIETKRIAGNKYLQLVRVGEKYMAIAVCKDTVTVLGEIPAEQIKFQDISQNGTSFRELLEKTIKKNSSDQRETKDRNE